MLNSRPNELEQVLVNSNDQKNDNPPDLKSHDQNEHKEEKSSNITCPERTGLFSLSLLLLAAASGVFYGAHLAYGESSAAYSGMTQADKDLCNQPERSCTASDWSLLGLIAIFCWARSFRLRWNFVS